MKKLLIALSLLIALALGGIKLASAQDQPKGQKDTVNMDTNAKPEFYYPVEDEKTKSGPGLTIAIAAGAVVIIGVAGFFLLRKKKK